MFQSPQWEDNSKEDINILDARVARFSPRNGEIILKIENLIDELIYNKFQSPQWGDNSKEMESIR